LTYGSDPFAYDLAAALEASTAARPTPRQIGQATARACGRLAGTYAEAFWTARRGIPSADTPPTRDQLVRHVEKFGPEGVQEVADAYGLGDIGAAVAEADLVRERKELARRHADNPKLLRVKQAAAGRARKSTLKARRIEQIRRSEMTVEEVAAELGVNEKTVKGWIR
jgi:transposase-like protein